MKNEEEIEELSDNPDTFFISEELSGVIQFNFDQLKKQKEIEEKTNQLKYSNIYGKEFKIPIKFLEFSGFSFNNTINNYKSSNILYNGKFLKLSYDDNLNIEDLLFINEMNVNLFLEEYSVDVKIKINEYYFDLENKTISSKEFEVQA